MNNKQSHVNATTWDAWKEACSIGNCKDEAQKDELCRFGQQQLSKALSRVSPDVAKEYCGEDQPFDKAWLTIENCLYVGTSIKSEKQGKAYKDYLIKSAVNSANFEARLALYINQSVARRILSDEGYQLSKKTTPEGARTATWWRTESLEDNAVIEQNLVEPEDALEFVEAMSCQGQETWDSWSMPCHILACLLLNGISDMDIIEKSGLFDRKKSQLYNYRKQIYDDIEGGCLKDGSLGPQQRAYLGRQLIAVLSKISGEWLEKLENSAVRRFIEMEHARQEART